MKYLILILMLAASSFAADSTGSVAQGNFSNFGAISDDRPTIEQWRTLQKRVREIEAGSRTTYDRNGFPLGQQQEGNKGRHRVSGTAKMDGSFFIASAAVNLNSIPSIDQQAISFRDSTSYNGTATPITYNGNTYQVTPLHGSRFTIVSSVAFDTATVRWTVEGE